MIDAFVPFFPSLLFDFGAGDGRLGRACAKHTNATWRGFDTEPLSSEVERYDVTLGPPPNLTDTVDLVIANPPFSHALRFLEVALQTAPRVAFLLPLAFLSSAKRRGFWQNAPLWRVLVLTKRPSFTGNGKTDSTDYAWFLFDSTATQRDDQLDLALEKKDAAPAKQGFAFK